MLTYTRFAVQDPERGAFAIRHEVCAEVGNSGDCGFKQDIDLTRFVFRGDDDPRKWTEDIYRREAVFSVTRPSESRICLKDQGVGVGQNARASEFPIAVRGSVTATVFDLADPSEKLSATWTVNISCLTPGQCGFSSSSPADFK